MPSNVVFDKKTESFAAKKHPIPNFKNLIYLLMMQKLIFALFLALPMGLWAQYNGTGAVTQGAASATTGNLYTCTGGRIARLGTITATNNTIWTVPAEVNFTNTSFPAASNLYNPCTGATYANATAAVAALNGNDIVNIDNDGIVITAYVFADNYFEMYINGVAVGKDNVPYTPFNSNIVRFKVRFPFTVAMLLVDWEENLGLGSESSGGSAYHDGDGGLVAVFKDANNKVLAITDNQWKAQTFYTAPITDLSCPTENGTARLSGNCSTQDATNGTSFYALHWARPANWQLATFDDSSWPAASTYTNTVIGVNNKPAYTNFTNIFDDSSNDAQFIWSSNVILDNEVIVRYTVKATSASSEPESQDGEWTVYPNPFEDRITVKGANATTYYLFYDAQGRILYAGNQIELQHFAHLPAGIYFLKIVDAEAKKIGVRHFTKR
jgi:hypothetical protein